MTKLLMTASSVLMCGIGLMLTFAPDIVSTRLEQPENWMLLLLAQLLGALYFGFGIMNWMGKAVLIGGIYSRPLSIGNFAHFLIGAMALIKIAGKTTTMYLWILTIIYIIFALLFGVVFLTNPKARN